MQKFHHKIPKAIFDFNVSRDELLQSNNNVSLHQLPLLFEQQYLKVPCPWISSLCEPNSNTKWFHAI